MATYVFKGDQGVQKLRKSRKLVGLRLKEDLDEHTDKSYIAE